MGASLLLCLTVLVAGTAFGNSMSYRKDAAVVPGYNTGTGRFVDQDRKMAIEIDAFTPAVAEQRSEGKDKVQEWGAEFQFNLNPVVVGSEFWLGDYAKKGEGGSGAALARDESYRITYNRFQLGAAVFSKRHEMKGWYGKVGYSYTKIDAETNLSRNDQMTYVNVDEVRHGPMAAAGRRFTFIKNRVSLNAGLAYTKTVNRELDAHGNETDDRYRSILANAGAKRLASKDFPEVRLAIGVLF